MKKFAALFFILSILLLNLFSMVSFAEEPMFNSLSVKFQIKEIPTLIEGGVSLSVTDENHNLLDTKILQIKRKQTYGEVNFSVPDYHVGKKFLIKINGGAKSLTYNEKEDTSVLVQPYVYVPQGSTDAAYETTFYMTLTPNWNKEAIIKIDGVLDTLYAHCFVNGELYVTTDLLSKLKINYQYNPTDAYPNVMLWSETGNYKEQFFINNIYATRGDTGFNCSIPTFTINDLPYVPLSEVAVYFACNYVVNEDNEYQRIVSLTTSAYSNDAIRAAYVNSKNITSKTNYMIWVSKSSYTVNVYKGKTGDWRFVTSFPCAIGAPSTPTIEGSFEYYQYQHRWTYANFYCGPIMRFYNGYALHSTLIKYNGNAYDNRVGVKISHGCVRIRPDGINWLANNIPLHTRVWVTA